MKSKILALILMIITFVYGAAVDWAFVSLTTYVAGRCFGFNLEFLDVTGVWLITCLIRFVAIRCRREKGK